MSIRIKSASQPSSETSKILRYAIICSVLWTLLMAGLTVELVIDTRRNLYATGRNIALEAFDNDLLFRRWASLHGGVYVPETLTTPANAHLAAIPERDVNTPSGRRLTLMNPAYMTRQLFEMVREQPAHPQRHITSLNPIRSENAADPWETKALVAFGQGVQEVTETVEISGQPYLRFMRPMMVEKPCLKCHSAQGYKEGDIRGGISVTLPLAALKETANSAMWNEALMHLIVWSCGLGFIWFGTKKILRVMTQLRDERNRLRLSEEALHENNLALLDQKKELQASGELLHDQNYELQATEEMLREQLNSYEISQKLLKESEERFKALSEATFGGIIIHDQGLIVECNDALSTITGYSREELIGMNGLKLIAPESLDLVIENIRSGYGKRYEVNGMRKCGSVYPLVIKGKNIPYKGHDVRVIEFRDITQHKQSEKEHKLLEEKLIHAQKLESLGVLAGGIAHDFNNILTIILGHCYMARQNMLSEDESAAAFKHIEVAGNRAADLCQQMLVYAGKSQQVQTRVNLWLLVDEVIRMLQSAIKKNVVIEQNLKSKTQEITGDIGQIQQVVMNLIINAAEAIGDKNGCIRVELYQTVLADTNSKTDAFGTVMKAGTYACLKVTDTGCGMDEETRKRIFEPFYTTKFTGRGLGMSATHGIIKSHEGFLNVTSEPGTGTTFKILFPVPEKMAFVESLAAAQAESGKADGTILLVDDERSLRDMGVNLLEAFGFSVIAAEHGRDALEIYNLHKNQINLVLLDLIMPVMGGIEAYRELRSISETLPIVICSGYNAESVDEIIISDPYVAFVHKPYKPSELRDVMVAMQ